MDNDTDPADDDLLGLLGSVAPDPGGAERRKAFFLRLGSSASFRRHGDPSAPFEQTRPTVRREDGRLVIAFDIEGGDGDGYAAKVEIPLAGLQLLFAEPQYRLAVRQLETLRKAEE